MQGCCSVPLLGAIAGCHCWGAIAGVPFRVAARCHCSVPLLDAIAGVPLLKCHCWVPPCMPLLGAIAENNTKKTQMQRRPMHLSKNTTERNNKCKSTRCIWGGGASHSHITKKINENKKNTEKTRFPSCIFLVLKLLPHCFREHHEEKTQEEDK